MERFETLLVLRACEDEVMLGRRRPDRAYSPVGCRRGLLVGSRYAFALARLRQSPPVHDDRLALGGPTVLEIVVGGVALRRRRSSPEDRPPEQLSRRHSDPPRVRARMRADGFDPDAAEDPRVGFPAVEPVRQRGE